jgi:hypothetical protein
MQETILPVIVPSSHLSRESNPEKTRPTARTRARCQRVAGLWCRSSETPQRLQIQLDGLRLTPQYVESRRPRRSTGNRGRSIGRSAWGDRCPPNKESWGDEALGPLMRVNVTGRCPTSGWCVIRPQNQMPTFQKPIRHSPARSVFWKGRPEETTGSRRKPTNGHRNPSPRTRASAMACWQVPE